jgi:exocyst complex component 3
VDDIDADVVSKGYLDVATKKCVATLVELIYNDLKPATKQLFTSTWYTGIMSQIIETIRDYMTDYRSHLNPLILDVLVEELIDTFLVIYLKALGNTSKLKMPDAIDRIKDDVREAFRFFSTLKPAKELEGQFEVVDLVLGLLEASRTMAFLSFWDFAKGVFVFLSSIPLHPIAVCGSETDSWVASFHSARTKPCLCRSCYESAG